MPPPEGGVGAATSVGVGVGAAPVGGAAGVGVLVGVLVGATVGAGVAGGVGVPAAFDLWQAPHTSLVRPAWSLGKGFIPLAP